jgi:predicted nucleotidyltransferase
MLGELFTSNTRAKVMGVLFDGQQKELYLRSLERECDISINALQKEIKHLLSIDLIKSRKDGNRVYYKANNHHPIYLDLVSIVEKTEGVVGKLKSCLSDKRISQAFIFGSFANETETSSSDIDLFVIGNISMRTLTKLMSGMQEKIGREINPHIFPENEIAKRRKAKDHFILNVAKSEKKLLIGSNEELEAIFG